MQLREFLKNQFLRFERLSVLLYYPYVLLNCISPYWSIPVLLYHKINECNNYDSDIHTSWFVSYATFNKQMEYLYKHNYKPISIQEYIDYIYNRRAFPKKSVLITFDDGYKSVHSLVYATLKKYSFPAVVFVTYEYIGTEKTFPWDEEISLLSKNISNELMPLTWEEIKEMQDLVSVGSHTMSHPHLALLSQEQIYYELSESKRLLEQKLGKEILSFAYPGGIRRYRDFSDLTSQKLIDTGYKVAFNSELGTNKGSSDPYLQKRIYVEERDSISMFASKLVGAYDWCRLAQCTFQKVFGDKSSY